MELDAQGLAFPLRLGPGKTLAVTDLEDDVRAMIEQILLTAPGERVNRPDFGCGLRRMVFAPNNPAAASLLKVSVKHSLDTWLSDVISVEDVAAESVDSTLSVKIRYTVKARQERRYLNLEVAL